MTLWEYVKTRMLRRGSCTVSEGATVVTYEEMVVFAERFAEKISGESCCAVCCRSELSCATAVLGCIAAGVTAAPLSLRYGVNHCKRILDALSPSCIVTDAGGSLGVYRISDSTYVPPRIHPALIMFTSGTTGVPKGAMLTESAVMANVSAVSGYFDIGRRDVLLISRPLYHCAALTDELLVALVRGCRVVFAPGAFDPVGLLKLMKTENVTAMGSTPTVLGLLSRLARRPAPLRIISVSGECMTDAAAEKIRRAFPKAKIYHAYGLTEAGTRISYLPYNEFGVHPCSVGYPLPGVDVKILDASGNSVKRGMSGELWVKGRNVMCGYYGQPELTLKTLRGGWLRTGDIAVEYDGKLYIKGRGDDMIIRAGINIFPQEIEAVLRKDSRTADVVAYGIIDEISGMKIGLKISGGFENEAEVRRMCVELLPSYEVPSVIELTDSIEKNGSGKLVRARSAQ